MNVVKIRKPNGLTSFDDAFDSLFKDLSGSWGGSTKSTAPRTEIRENADNFYQRIKKLRLRMKQF